MSTLSRVFVAAAILMLAAGTALAAAKPAIKFDKTEITLQDVEEGKHIVTEFQFRNTGGMNLVIDEVSPSCGCTVAKFTEVTRPGEKGTVSLDLDTDGIVGHFRKTATVVTNDPDNPFVTLVMLGETMSAVKVEGGRRVELNGCLGQPMEATVKLTNPKGGPILVTGVENPLKDYCSAELKRAADGMSYDLVVKSVVTHPVRFAGQIFLLTPGNPKVSVWVVGDVRGLVSIRPEIVFFGSVTKDKLKGAARSVELSRACAEAMPEPTLTYDANKFEISQKWEKPGDKLLLVITPKPDAFEKGAFREELRINTGRFLFTVPLRGTVY